MIIALSFSCRSGDLYDVVSCRSGDLYDVVSCRSGDLYDEEEILDWLTNPDNMELTDAIEKINRKMFARLAERTDHYFAVFFCKAPDDRNTDKVKLAVISCSNYR